MLGQIGILWLTELTEFISDYIQANAQTNKGIWLLISPAGIMSSEFYRLKIHIKIQKTMMKEKNTAGPLSHITATPKV